MIWRISRRRVGTGFSFSQQTPTLHRSLSFFFSFLDYCFARWFCSAGLECSHSTWRVNGEVANLKQWRDATQPKNTISMPPEKPSSPPSIPQSFPFLPSFTSSSPRRRFIEGESDGSSCSVKRNLFSFFLVQIEQKRTGDMKPTSPAALTRRTWVDLWVMIWSVYRCNPHPPITSHLSHGVWSHEEVNYCKELQEVLFFFCQLLK